MLHLVASQSDHCLAKPNLFNRNLIFDPQFPFFEKNSLIVFQNNLLSVMKDGLRVLKYGFLSF